jgi:hypothetical protein
MAIYNTSNNSLQEGNKTLFEMSMQNSGSLYSAPWDLQVARGKVQGVTQINIFGYSSNVTNSGYVTLWEDGVMNFMTSEAYLNVYSTSSSDAGAKILISGLDANYAMISETLTISPSGIANTTTTKKYLRVNSFQMTTPNTNQITNIGTITAKNAANVAMILPSVGRMQNAWYSIPAGYSFYVRNINIFSGETKTGATPTWFYYRVKNHSNITGMHYDVLTTSFQNEYKVQRTNPVRYTEKSDIEWQISSSDNGPHTVGIILEGLLISDTAP